MKVARGYSVCNNEVTLELLNMEIQPRCLSSIPCDHMEFYVDGEYPRPNLHGETVLSFTIQDNQEHLISYVTVDCQTMMAQIGGILGITIGWSFHSIRFLIPWIMAGVANMMRFFSLR